MFVGFGVSFRSFFCFREVRIFRVFFVEVFELVWFFFVYEGYLWLFRVIVLSSLGKV